MHARTWRHGGAMTSAAETLSQRGKTATQQSPGGRRAAFARRGDEAIYSWSGGNRAHHIRLVSFRICRRCSCLPLRTEVRFFIPPGSRVFLLPAEAVRAFRPCRPPAGAAPSGPQIASRLCYSPPVRCCWITRAARPRRSPNRIHANEESCATQTRGIGLGHQSSRTNAEDHLAPR